VDDVAVIGGGVAGLATVRALQRLGAAPTLIMPSRRRRESHGETLGPAAREALQKLGWCDLLDDPAVALPVEAVYSVWGSDLMTRRTGDFLSGHLGWHVDRRRLEAAMRASLDATRLRLIEAIPRHVERAPHGWRLHLTSGGSETARFVIDASGRAAIVARMFGTRRRLDRLVAAFGTYEVPDVEVHRAILVEAMPSGWCYSAPLPNRRVFVARFGDADLLPRAVRRDENVWPRLLEGAPCTSARLHSLGVAPSAQIPSVIAASTAVQTKVYGSDWAAVGDAAAALDPLGSHGLSVALWSGERAGPAALAMLNGDRVPLATYAAALTGGLGRYAAASDVYYGAERRFPDAPFWRRRAVPRPAP
jgi:2-polyprenyl-6-methoxyphenol hydroxylase-like FAD-dependent oxidoreductase